MNPKKFSTQLKWRIHDQALEKTFRALATMTRSIRLLTARVPSLQEHHAPERLHRFWAPALVTHRQRVLGQRLLLWGQPAQTFAESVLAELQYLERLCCVES